MHACNARQAACHLKLATPSKTTNKNKLNFPLQIPHSEIREHCCHFIQRALPQMFTKGVFPEGRVSCI